MIRKEAEMIVEALQEVLDKKTRLDYAFAKRFSHQFHIEEKDGTVELHSFRELPSLESVDVLPIPTEGDGLLSVIWFGRDEKEPTLQFALGIKKEIDLSHWEPKMLISSWLVQVGMELLRRLEKERGSEEPPSD